MTTKGRRTDVCKKCKKGKPGREFMNLCENCANGSKMLTCAVCKEEFEYTDNMSLCGECKAEYECGEMEQHKKHDWVIERETGKSFVFKCYDCNERMNLLKEGGVDHES